MPCNVCNKTQRSYHAEETEEKVSVASFSLIGVWIVYILVSAYVIRYTMRKKPLSAENFASLTKRTVKGLELGYAF